MTKNKKCILGIYVILNFSFYAKGAGGDVGNGGDVIVCFPEHGDKVLIHYKQVFGGEGIYDNGQIEVSHPTYTKRDEEGKLLKNNFSGYKIEASMKNLLSYPKTQDSISLLGGTILENSSFIPIQTHIYVRNLKTGTENAETVTYSAADYAKSMVTREYYLAMLRNPHSKFLKKYQDATYREALLALHNLVNISFWYAHPEVPISLSQLEDAGTTVNGIGSLAKALNDDKGLDDIRDEGKRLNLPHNCTQIQAVVREGFLMTKNPDVWNNLGLRNLETRELTGQGLQRALLQFHEETYYLGTEKYGHKDSIYTQNLIVSLLIQDEPWTDQQFRALLKKTHFLQ